MSESSRVPPAAVRRQLRQEVGFACPVPGCPSPYLTWHHFDPPWHVKQHHDPAGMVALCRDHHPEADAGAFTDDQLREFKHAGRDRSGPIGARMNWMRQQLVAVVGGNFYVDCPIAVRVLNYPVVWFSRDEQGQILVNLRQLTGSGEPRMMLLDNFWITEGSAEHDIECPPSGRLVKASYPNGDRLKVEFRSHASWEEFDRRYSRPEPPRRRVPSIPPGTSREDAARIRRWHAETSAMVRELPRHSENGQSFGLELPLTTVEVEMHIAGSGFKLGARSMTLPGSNVITGSWMVNCQVGVQVGDASAAA